MPSEEDSSNYRLNIGNKIFQSVHLIFPEKFRGSGNVEIGVDASNRPVDGVGDDEGADDGQIELVVANYALKKRQHKILETLRRHS